MWFYSEDMGVERTRSKPALCARLPYQRINKVKKSFSRNCADSQRPVKETQLFIATKN